MTPLTYTRHSPSTYSQNGGLDTIFKMKNSLQFKIGLSYFAIIIAVLVILNTYPLIESQNLVFRSKETLLTGSVKAIESALSGLSELTQSNVEKALSGLEETGVYEAIVKGENVPEPGVPESFKVLIKELQSLGLDIKVLNETKEEIKIGEMIDDEDVAPMDVNMAGLEDTPDQYANDSDFAEFDEFDFDDAADDGDDFDISADGDDTDDLN